MRYPVTNTGSKEDFVKDWYIAQGFGAKTSYGYHEGVDINLRSGGDTDLGQELKAIAKGKIVYYHYASHPSSGYGRHLVLKIDGAWGTRWVHYAHCMEQDFTKEVKEVNEGDIIARLGKSGTPYAHLHFAILKIDPITLGGIDNIANTTEELYQVWENPLEFIDKWMNVSTQPELNDQTTYDFGDPWGVMEMQAVRSKMNDQKRDIENLNIKIENAKIALN